MFALASLPPFRSHFSRTHTSSHLQTPTPNSSAFQRWQYRLRTAPSLVAPMSHTPSLRPYVVNPNYQRLSRHLTGTYLWDRQRRKRIGPVLQAPLRPDSLETRPLLSHNVDGRVVPRQTYQIHTMHLQFGPLGNVVAFRNATRTRTTRATSPRRTQKPHRLRCTVLTKIS